MNRGKGEQEVVYERSKKGLLLRLILINRFFLVRPFFLDKKQIYGNKIQCKETKLIKLYKIENIFVVEFLIIRYPLKVRIIKLLISIQQQVAHSIHVYSCKFINLWIHRLCQIYGYINP